MYQSQVFQSFPLMADTTSNTQMYNITMMSKVCSVFLSSKSPTEANRIAIVPTNARYEAICSSRSMKLIAINTVTKEMDTKGITLDCPISICSKFMNYD